MIWMDFVECLEASVPGFRNAGEQMRAAYEDPSLRESAEEVYNQVAPLYKQLLTYVRRRLIQRYGNHTLRPDGPLPAHLLGIPFSSTPPNTASFILQITVHSFLYYDI